MQALVVDDDELTARVMQVCLTRLGYEVTTVGDGMAALEMCKTRAFDVVISDVRMPRLNGISFIKNVKRMAPGATNRIIVVSSMDDRATRNDALAAGAEAFLLKPVSTATIAELLSAPGASKA